MSEHTKGRLSIDARFPNVICREDGTSICIIESGDPFTVSENDGNARRLVACWNAFHVDSPREPISTKDIVELGPGIAGPHIRNRNLQKWLSEAKRDRDELMEALWDTRKFVITSTNMRLGDRIAKRKQLLATLDALFAKHAPKGPA